MNIKSSIFTSLCVLSGLMVRAIPCLAASEVEVPNKMLPNTIIEYNDSLEYSIETGGEISENNTSKGESDVYAVPGMRAIYGKDGLLRNVYYLVDGEYQLSPPANTLKDGMSRNGTGVNKKGSGKYSYNSCVLNFKRDEVVGNGPITYYGQPDNPNQTTPFIGDHDNILKVGDCATKWYVDDVPYGVIVTAKNKRNDKVMTFTKNDCGKLPNAILDIFEDGNWSKKGIRGLTVNNVKDSVDNGWISHSYSK